jgi:vacuolar-type H+-ATPase subunit F/Vma7
MKTKFLLIFFTITLFELAGAKTICTITINSKNEINVFKNLQQKKIVLLS